MTIEPETRTNDCAVLEVPSPPQRLSIVWPIAVFAIGFGINATLLLVSYCIAQPDWISSWDHWRWLRTFSEFTGPYALCAIGLRVAHLARPEYFETRVLAGVVVLAGLPGLLAAWGMQARFEEKAIPYTLLGHMLVAELALWIQYPSAVLCLCMALPRHRKPLPRLV